MSARNFYIMQSAVAPMQSELPCYTPLTNHRTEVHTVPLVLASDYAALEAERDTLRQQLADVFKGNTKLHVLWTEAVQQRDKLAGLLREVSDEWRTRQSEYLLERIDAALSELTP